MVKRNVNTSWRKLDNTAKIFSLDNKKNINTFRYSVIFKETVDVNILNKSVKIALSKYSSFKVKLGTGVFWNYLEFNPKEPIIKEENEIPCHYIDFKKNNEYLFKVTYYKKKVNLDVFHVLTDGTGAQKFLKAIIYNYLNLKYNLPFKELTTYNDINYQDQYLKNYDKTLKSDFNAQEAYQIKHKMKANINNTHHYIIDIDELKKICKNYNVTITEYLTAIYIYAIYLSLYKKKSKKEIIITVPINLRKYYSVDTLSNFFVGMNINPKIVENKLTTFDEILKQVHLEFKEKLDIKKVKSYVTKDVKLGTNIPIRLVPLFIKKIFIKFVVALVSKSSTSTLSNVGIVDIDDKYKKYIDNILVLVMPNKIHKIKCTVCSFDKKLNVTINSKIDNKNFEHTFLKLLQQRVDNIKIESNNYVN